MNNKTTYVSGFWNIPHNKKRARSRYTSDIFINTLNWLRGRPLVAYGNDTKYLNIVSGRPHTEVHKVLIKDLPTWSIADHYVASCSRSPKASKKKGRRNKARINRRYRKKSRRGWRELLTVWLSKIYLVEKAIYTNPFDSDIFVWVDAGVSKSKYITRRKSQPVVGDFTEVISNKALYVYPCVGPDRRPPWYRGGDLSGMAGVLGGPADLWLEFIESYTQVLEAFSVDPYCHDEETLIHEARKISEVPWVHMVPPELFAQCNFEDSLDSVNKLIPGR